MRKGGFFEAAITEVENGGREIDVLRTAKTDSLEQMGRATAISVLAQGVSLLLRRLPAA
jgi:hypothetical protein